GQLRSWWGLVPLGPFLPDKVARLTGIVKEILELEDQSLEGTELAELRNNLKER
ncbi:hypothetical protein AMTR_s00004p00270150, partial [Amborella trichopoda]